MGGPAAASDASIPTTESTEAGVRYICQRVDALRACALDAFRQSSQIRKVIHEGALIDVTDDDAEVDASIPQPYTMDM